MNREESIEVPKRKGKNRVRLANKQTDTVPNSQNEIKTLLSRLLWDRDSDADYYLQLLQKDHPAPSEEKELQALYIKILNFNSWHVVVKLFGVTYAVENMLTDNVIRGLFPRPLRKKYEFVRSVLSEAL